MVGCHIKEELQTTLRKQSSFSQKLAGPPDGYKPCLHADIPPPQAHFPRGSRAPAAETPKELGNHSSLGLDR
jgi:hypothetical protein